VRSFGVFFFKTTKVTTELPFVVVLFTYEQNIAKHK